MKDRSFLKLEVSQHEKARFEEFCERFDLSQLRAGTKLFSWFLKQESLIQDLVMDRVNPLLRAEAKRQLVEKLVPPPEKVPSEFPTETAKRSAG